MDGHGGSVSMNLIRKLTNPESLPPSVIFNEAPEVWDIIPLP